MPHAGKDHRDACFIGRRDHFVVPHRAARLNHRSDTHLGCVVDAVAEREECIRGHDRALHLQARMLGLDGGDAGRIDPAHLAGTDTDGLAVFRIDDGVGLDVLGDFPGEDQVVDFLLARCTFGHDFEVVGGDHADVAALYQKAAVDALVVPCRRTVGSPLAAGQQSHVGFAGDNGLRLGADAWGDDHFNELALDDGPGGLGVQFTVEGDDAAECRLAVGGVGQLVGLADTAFGVRADGNPTRVGVLDDDAGWLDEALDAFQRGIGISHVVVGQLLALQLGGSGDAHFGRFGFNVERRALVRILAVAHFLSLDELAVEGARKFAAAFCAQGLGALVNAAQIIGDHAVVGGGMFERLEHQVETLCIGQAAGLEALDHLAVVAGVDHDGHVFVVFRSGTDHGRTADVDVLDGGRQIAAWLGYGGFERIEVDRHQVDRLDAVLAHDGVVDTATTQDAAVDFRVQGLDPAIHHFRETGVVRDFYRCDAV